MSLQLCKKSLGVERVSKLEELLPQSEFISLHCPLTAETRHILGAKTLPLLPRGAYVINTARGPCVDATCARVSVGVSLERYERP